jgi:hypothetical protein
MPKKRFGAEPIVMPHQQQMEANIGRGWSVQIADKRIRERAKAPGFAYHGSWQAALNAASPRD